MEPATGKVLRMGWGETDGGEIDRSRFEVVVEMTEPPPWSAAVVWTDDWAVTMTPKRIAEPSK